MKKVMILGAGRGQIPLMELCHSYGYSVVAVSPEGNYPGLQVADEICYTNVRDKEAVLEKAKEYGICAIVSDQLDVAVETVAYVSTNLGLPGNMPEVAERFTNKFVMRQAAAALGICVPASVCISSLEDAEKAIAEEPAFKFPLMLKPVDSAASRGVYKVNSLAEIAEKLPTSLSYSKVKAAILEQFVQGKEYVIDAYTHNHVTTNLIVGHRDYFQIPNTFIPNATVFHDAESANSPLEIRLKEINKRLAEGLGLNFGITHAEYLYNESEDAIYLVEIAARGGGVFISSHLIPSASGVNANDLLVRDALGLGGADEIQMTPGASAYFCYLTPKGTVTALEGIESVSKVPGVVEAFFDNIYLGMNSLSITDKSSRKGPILVKGHTKEECYCVIEQVKAMLRIEVTDDTSVRSVIWHDVV